MSRFWIALSMIVLPVCVLCVACGREPDEPSRSEASRATAEMNRRAAAGLDFEDRQAFVDAERGLVASVAPSEVSYPNAGAENRSLADWAFLDADAPDSVHPSLWRQAQLNNRAGLFEVVPGVYQLRGFDLANMTLIRGKTGWIVVDPLTTESTARAALAFARKHLGDEPVTAVLFTHSHADHFGGVLGVIGAEEARSRAVPIIAPEGFIEAATKENLLAGPAMFRRTAFVYGQRLNAGPLGHVGIGLGKVLALGATGILAPTQEVTQTGERLVVDGVRIVFQLAQGSEAPAEFMFYLPDFAAFCGAEVVSQTMHNLYTLRGARVRDALSWSAYIDEAIELFPGAEVYFGSHHWPVWGRERVVDFLAGQRDLYKYIHDQTLRLANAGLTPREIAEELVLPDSLARRFSSRGYYGSLEHNVKAVYQYYFGWYDGNPANLNPLPPVEAAKRYVDLAGGPEPLMQNARAAFDAGEYRWAAELLNHLVFARPDDRAARELLASNYRQLGYQSESTQWRNSYLVAALELETGVEAGPSLIERASADILQNTPVSGFFDALAVGLDGPRAGAKDVALNVVFTDLGEAYVLDVSNGVLHHRKGETSPDAAATLTITHEMFVRMLTGQAGIQDVLTSDDVSLEGSTLGAIGFFRLFSPAAGNFDIVTP